MSHIPHRDRGFVSIGALAADCLARIGQHQGRVDRPRPTPGIGRTNEPVLGAGVRHGADTAGAAVLAGGDLDA
jgi:hypothetical protein